MTAMHVKLVTDITFDSTTDLSNDKGTIVHYAMFASHVRYPYGSPLGRGHNKASALQDLIQRCDMDGVTVCYGNGHSKTIR